MLGYFVLMLSSGAALGVSAQEALVSPTEARVRDTDSITIIVTVRPLKDRVFRPYDQSQKGGLKYPQTKTRIEKIDRRDLLIVFEE